MGEKGYQTGENGLRTGQFTFNGTSRRLSSLQARLNIVTGSCTSQRASHHWVFAEAVSYPLRRQP